MDADSFFTKHLQPVGTEFFAGIVSIDIEHHRRLIGSEATIGMVRESLRVLVESEIRDEPASLLPWQGDGGAVVFDIAKGGDAMVLFADRLNQLLPWLNRTRSQVNPLPYGQTIAVRIVCHAGHLLNGGSPASLCGNALNEVCKHEREVGRAGHVVMSSKVYGHIADALKRRCVPQQPPHQELGQTFVLDGTTSWCTVEETDRHSLNLADWIRDALRRHRYTQLLYFAYTNELLHDFLAYELPSIAKIDVKIVVRSWLVEREEEEEFNRRERWGVRPWKKAEAIKLLTEQLIQHSERQTGAGSVEVRFYDGPPVFNGAILADEEGPRCARVGIVSWEEKPQEGGSPYKLEEWPALCLDSSDSIQAKQIHYFESRFKEMWSKGHTYQDLCTREDVDPRLVSEVWALDGKPYLIVYPHRRVPDRSFPVVAYEDVMALRGVEAFVKQHRARAALFPVQLPNILQRDWFPADAAGRIEGWDGHVIFICSKVLPPAFLHAIDQLGFPYEFRNVGSAKPGLYHRTSRHEFTSPTDRPEQPEALDYSLVAKVRQPRKASFAYILAGIRAMGTWGAARYLISGAGIKELARAMQTNCFAALVKTSFDPDSHQVTDVAAFVAPEKV